MNDKQLNVFCEGPTEQGFCAQVLQSHLFPLGDGIVHTLAVGKKDHHHLHGLGAHAKYEKIRKFISGMIHGRAGENVYFTTMFDLYALPKNFPGKQQNVRNSADPTPYVMALEAAFEEDIRNFRFIAYLQLHEYETMLFADPNAFAGSFENCGDQIQQLKAIAQSERSIEHIDDGKKTTPSKRIINILPAYDGRKASAGPDIAARIGVKTIRENCPHFHGWLSRLENLTWA